MYKSKLQELCQRRRLQPPEYTVTRDGPDHIPRFRATVSVAGASFDAHSPAASSKEARNLAAQVALEHLVSIPVPATPPSLSFPPQASISAESSPASASAETYRSRLQELCQRRRLPPPKYTVARHSSDHDHNSCFRATVSVAGASFDVSSPAASSKEACNLAARAALEHLVLVSPDTSPASSSDTVSSAKQISFKSQLQNYVRKNKLDLPLFSHTCEGPAHCLQFKATVVVNGENFESAKSFGTLKEAEHDAARVALLSLPNESVKKVHDEPGFYKMILHELAQKECFSLPKYTTVCSGVSHKLMFSSTVEVEGECFQGDIGKNKKVAEGNAAKVALCQFKERGLVTLCGNGALSYGAQKVELPASSTSLTPKVITMIEPDGLSHSKSWLKIEEGVQKLSGGLVTLHGNDTLSCKAQKVGFPASSTNLTPKVISMIEPVGLSPSKSRLEIEGVERLSVTTPDDNSTDRTVDEGCSTVVIKESIPCDLLNASMEDVKSKDKQPAGSIDELGGNSSIPFSSNMFQTFNQRNASHKYPQNSKKGTFKAFVDMESLFINDITVRRESFSQSSGQTNLLDPLDAATLSSDLFPRVTSCETTNCAVQMSDSPESKSLAPLNSGGQMSDSGESKSLAPSVPSDHSSGKTNSWLCCNRVRVYPNKPGIVPEGATILPCSDDKWVAVQLDFSRQGACVGI